MAIPPALTSDTARAVVADSSLRAEVDRGGEEYLSRALEAVGDRWSLAVVAFLTGGPQRFSDIASGVAPIARTVLSDRLRKLEAAGVISRRQYSTTPVRWQYRLTVAGADLARVCGLLADWSARHLVSNDPAAGPASIDAALRHVACGGEVSPAWRCASCGTVPAREVATSL